MNEDFLCFLWQYKLFSKVNLVTTKNLGLFIKKTGVRNYNSGPDYFNSQVLIDGQLWAGTVEMHIKSSDWYLHKHEEDENYDAVILHVVWEHDAEVFMKNNLPLPTFEMRNFIDDKVLINYNALMYVQKWIPCQDQIQEVDNFFVRNWLERLYFERLEEKSVQIHSMLAESNNDYEAVLFQLICKNFGLKVNGASFLQLAKSFDFNIVRKLREDEHHMAALFFGQSGFLQDDLENHYFQELKKSYQFLAHKYQLQSISKNQFQFFRMRPNNFPTIRIAQLASLFSKYQNLFSTIMAKDKKEEFYNLLDLEVDDFWKSHYTFESSSKKSQKKLSKQFIDLLLINTVIPLKFVYLKSRGEDAQERIIRLMQQIAPEKNSILSKFSEFQIDAKNAMESQALITLKNTYCTQKRCLQCAIGNHLLRRKK